MPLYGQQFPILAPDGAVGAPSYASRTDPTSGLYFSAGTWKLAVTGVYRFNFGASEFTIAHSSAAIGFSTDTILLREAAGTLALLNGANAQTFRVYNTTDAGVTNYERLSFDWTGNVAYIRTANVGTGSARSIILSAAGSALYLGAGATYQWLINSSGHLLANVDNTYDIGASGATRPRNVYVGTDIISGNSLQTVGAVVAGAASSYRFNGRSRFLAPSDGVIQLTNDTQTDFSRLQFGGTTSSFPALKRSSTVLQARLADDSDFAPLQGKLRTQANAVAETPTATHTMIITDAGGTAYRVLCVV